MSELRRATPYLVGPWIDAVLGGGLSLLVLLAMIVARAAGHSLIDARFGSGLALLMWVGQSPHFSATNGRLYRSWSAMRQFPVTAFAVPLIFVGGAVAAFAFPSDVAPPLILLFALWLPYHFSAQTLGIALIYARRAGREPSCFERGALTWFVFAVCLYAWTTSFSPHTSNFYGIVPPRLRLPRGLVEGSLASVLVTGAALGFVLVRGWRRGHAAFPAIALVPITAHGLWFVVGTSYPHYREIFIFAHGLQYLLVAWWLYRQQHPTARVWAPLIWFGRHCAGGALLFAALPLVVARGLDADPDFSIGVLWAIVQTHHFLVDGVIWKLRGGTTGEAATAPALAALAS